MQYLYIFRNRIALRGRLDGKQQKALLVEARIDGIQVGKRAHEKACADQQQHAQGDLHNDQCLAGEPLAAARNCLCTVLKAGVRAGARSLPCGSDSKTDPGEN